ncbi:hypothetical protein Desgi_3148 [Calderihabitans maritimus]|uniref:Copper amine oxidase-like N-terminal domain-containing protein n=1 Tax=Calderihabitans maritimus TaxID=1246530 RepID=A0A1Z5HPR4_9FIRM|nr:hypothetical protein Desgi_3148 [Calderihabitans maritimus]
MSFALLLLPGLADTGRVAELPSNLGVDDIQRVEFSRSDTSFRSLFPNLPEDRVKIEQLIKLYNLAIGKLGPEEPWDDGSYPMLYFLPQVRLELKDGRNVTIILHETVSIYAETPVQSHTVTDPELAKKLKNLASSYFVPAEGVTINSRFVRLGDEITVRSDVARGKEATILLMPSYWPVTIPSAPAPFPVPEAILLATVPVENDSFSYTFTLSETMGERIDGTPGRPGPGAWHLVVNGGGQTMIPITILPSGPPEPRAVVYDQGRVLTWTPTEGIQEQVLDNPQDQPLNISEPGRGSPVTHISLGFLEKWLDIPVTPVDSEQYRLGPEELGLTVRAGEDFARVNGTMVALESPLVKTGGVSRLPWVSLGYFFGYRVQWLGPERVAFLRNLDQLPEEVRRELGAPRTMRMTGRTVTVTLDGKKLDLGIVSPYLDLVRSRVMVPLRATVEALGGKVDWFSLKENYAEVMTDHNYGLKPFGEKVNSYVDISFKNKSWRLYLTPTSSGVTVVPLRELALVLGYGITWNGPKAQVNLHSPAGLK